MSGASALSAAKNRRSKPETVSTGIRKQAPPCASANGSCPKPGGANYKPASNTVMKPMPVMKPMLASVDEEPIHEKIINYLMTPNQPLTHLQILQLHEIRLLKLEKKEPAPVPMPMPMPMPLAEVKVAPVSTIETKLMQTKISSLETKVATLETSLKSLLHEFSILQNFAMTTNENLQALIADIQHDAGAYAADDAEGADDADADAEGAVADAMADDAASAADASAADAADAADYAAPDARLKLSITENNIKTPTPTSEKGN
jgi:hypothetical protein